MSEYQRCGKCANWRGTPSWPACCGIEHAITTAENPYVDGKHIERWDAAHECHRPDDWRAK